MKVDSRRPKDGEVLNYILAAIKDAGYTQK